jgi:hypothetical protein
MTLSPRPLFTTEITEGTEKGAELEPQMNADERR